VLPPDNTVWLDVALIEEKLNFVIQTEISNLSVRYETGISLKVSVEVDAGSHIQVSEEFSQKSFGSSLKNQSKRLGSPNCKEEQVQNVGSGHSSPTSFPQTIPSQSRLSNNRTSVAQPSSIPVQPKSGEKNKSYLKKKGNTVTKLPMSEINKTFCESSPLAYFHLEENWDLLSCDEFENVTLGSFAYGGNASSVSIRKRWKLERGGKKSVELKKGTDDVQSSIYQETPFRVEDYSALMFAFEYKVTSFDYAQHRLFQQ